MKWPATRLDRIDSGIDARALPTGGELQWQLDVFN
jgi:hypothetical protein